MSGKYGKAEVENLKWDDAAWKVKQVYGELTNGKN
jgi:hypothetical protein